MKESTNREEAVFNGALQLPAGQRAVYLDGACGGDDQFRRRVEVLLLASDHAGAFLEEACSAARPKVDTAPPAATPETIRIELPPEPTEKAGSRIGRYRLLQEIGEGGCGVVYMAEQQEPVKRRVALKLIKLGMDTKQVIARFEAERQALALMDHPNIAKVLDAGTSELGRPFFVMELVRGIKITDYCDKNNISTRDRLELFIEVCMAIQHAHQKGIIHRDIKPSNILVTMHDGVAQTKVIDFGIAKATDQRLTDKTIFTAFEQFMGTPAYMSPEQAEMSALDIDTRSDIYSLGVLLYELLTGKTPFDPKQLMQSGIDAMRRTIREKEPSRPSTKLSTMMQEDLLEAARHRQIEPGKLTRLLRGDLDWIVMKSLEKDRTRRYETANGLAVDVRRFLHDEAIIARPPSRLYQFQKLARRNKGIFAAAMFVLAALTLGLGLSTFLLVKEMAANRRVVMAEKRAAHVTDFLTEILQDAGPEKALGADTTLLRAILDKNSSDLDVKFKDEPEVEAELRQTMGQTYYELGDYVKTEEMQRRSLGLKQKMYGEVNSNSISSVEYLATTLTDEGKLAEAVTDQREVIELNKKLFGDFNPAVAYSLNELGRALWLRGDLAEAESNVNASVDMWTKLPPGENPDHIIDARCDLGLIQWERGKFADAEKSLQACLDVGKQFNDTGGSEYAGSLNNLANVYLSEGKLNDAETTYRSLLEKLEGLLPPTHPHLLLVRSHLAVAVRRIGGLTGDKARLLEALLLDPADFMTADALTCAEAKPSLTALAPDDPAAWEVTPTKPDENWKDPDYPDSGWSKGQAKADITTYSPRTDRASPCHTNLWLRRELLLKEIPRGKLALLLNRDQDAEVFLNGVQIAPALDWSDSKVLVPCWTSAAAALRTGRNVLAIHCQDLDAGTTVDAQIYVSSDPSLGRKQLIEEYDAMLQADPNRAEIYAGRANARARMGDWKEAASDLEKAIELKRDTLAYWSQLAPLLVQMGNRSGYDQLRERAVRQFGDRGGPSVNEPLAKLCLLMPTNGLALDLVLNLAENVAGPGYANATLARRQCTEGLAEYRRGHFANAIEWMRKAWATSGEHELPAWDHERQRNLEAGADLVESMAYMQLDQTDDAHDALARATGLLRKQFPEADNGDVGREWQDWVMVQILYREAKGVVEEKNEAKISHRPNARAGG